jgi:hypothetical protein
VTTPPGGYPASQPQYAQPAPQYLTPQPYPRQPAPPRAQRWVPGLLAAFLFLIAAGAAVWGSFEKLQNFRSERAGREAATYMLTWWKLDQVNMRPDDAALPPYGALPAAAAGLLVIAAVLALTAFGSGRSGAVSATRVSAALGAGLLAGATAVALLDGLHALDQVNAQEAEPQETITFELGLGVWLPAGAVVVALIGLALALTRPKSARVEPATPPMGFLVPRGAPSPFQPGPAHAQPQVHPAYQHPQQTYQPPEPPRQPEPPQPAESPAEPVEQGDEGEHPAN